MHELRAEGTFYSVQVVNKWALLSLTMLFLMLGWCLGNHTKIFQFAQKLTLLHKFVLSPLDEASQLAVNELNQL